MTQDFGEPWDGRSVEVRCIGTENGINTYSLLLTQSELLRMFACVNALAGIANPDKLGELLDALWFAREALRLTQEYVGDDLLPKLPGWSWFDGLTRADAALAAIGDLPAGGAP